VKGWSELKKTSVAKPEQQVNALFYLQIRIKMHQVLSFCTVQVKAGEEESETELHHFS
jgi:hypothetical protein